MRWARRYGVPLHGGVVPLCALARYCAIIGGLVSIMSTPTKTAFVKTSVEMVRVSMGSRESTAICDERPPRERLGMYPPRCKMRPRSPPLERLQGRSLDPRTTQLF